jgi:hypothetical protein
MAIGIGSRSLIPAIFGRLRPPAEWLRDLLHIPVLSFSQNSLPTESGSPSQGNMTDILVENEPASVIAVHDPQLERGSAEMIKELKAHPKVLPSRPSDPDY